MAVLALAGRELAHRPVAQAVAVEAALHRRARRALGTVREARVARRALQQDVVRVREDDLRRVVVGVGDVAVTASARLLR